MREQPTHPVLFAAGMDAYAAGQFAHRNPYRNFETPSQHNKFKSWAAGWQQAKRNDRDEEREASAEYEKDKQS